jgi:N-acetylglucosaminyldiphosphoundecaprenol N-acetyl-beta-D-mannosaminyltransferase
MRTFELLDTPLLAITYNELTRHCEELARRGRTCAIDFTNTHIVTLRQHDPRFREITSNLDYFVPDGMPLVWCLNARGAALRDRVYGPVFMRTFLERASGEFTHYLLGGSEECGARLRQRFPTVKFIGSFHGKCSREGVLEGAAEEGVIAEMNHLLPDFIWVGLGTPKQYEWIHRQKARLTRGVIFAIGFAFDVNAGLKPDAPLGMQRAGLTWAFRAYSEPQRLLSRYVRYNTLFLYYLAKDALKRVIRRRD